LLIWAHSQFDNDIKKMVPAMEGDIQKCHPEEALLTEAALVRGCMKNTFSSDAWGAFAPVPLPPAHPPLATTLVVDHECPTYFGTEINAVAFLYRMKDEQAEQKKAEEKTKREQIFQAYLARKAAKEEEEHGGHPAREPPRPKAKHKPGKSRPGPAAVRATRRVPCAV
jgi:hypothetical protein